MSPGDPPLALEPGPDGLGFFIHVTPRSRGESVGPAHGDALRVRVTAPPLAGRANAACARALARALGVPARDVTLDPAARGRRKRVFVAGDPVDLSEKVHMLATRSGLG